MMVIKTCVVARDTSIVDVVANAVVVVAWKTIRTAMETSTLTRIRCLTTSSITIMVKWEAATTSSNNSSSNSSRCQWAWVKITSRCHNSSNPFSRSWCQINSRCRCQLNKRWCNFLKWMLPNLIHSKVMTETTSSVTTFTRLSMPRTVKSTLQPLLVCSLMKQLSITSCFWPRTSTSKVRLGKPMSCSSRPNRTKSNKWQCSSRRLRTSEHQLDLLTSTKIELIRQSSL